MRRYSEIPKLPALWFVLLGLLSTASYLVLARLMGVSGFPLDDAWIHQTYARNLAALGEWSFVPGQPSAGSTSPLWTLLLTGGYLLRLDFYLWTGLLGGLLLGLTAWLGYRLVLQLWPHRRGAAIASGIFIALEWHLVWAAASGMETVLFIALALGTLLLATSRSAAAWSGLLAGLAMWARPDGLTLLPVAAGALWLAAGRSRERLRRLALLCAGFLAAALPYLWLNHTLGGAIWPNTFFAKQAEYAVLREAPLWRRLAQVLVRPLTGPLVLIVPGTLLVLRERHWVRLVPLAWGLVYLGVYALRLPAIYQYGRYVMPAIPALAVVGLGGAAGIINLRSHSFSWRVFSRVWALAAGLTLLIFWGVGARRFVTDVRIIDSEMVASARWVAQNTAPNVIVAAHDIGALGYFGARQLVDLAGLVSPEVIPFIRDEQRLSAFIRAQEADYLVTFPGWYPALVAEPEWQLAYTTNASYAPADGGENMAVYVRIPPD